MQAWLRGPSKCLTFPSQLQRVEFLQETVYLSVHNNINPPLPSDAPENHWVRRENGQMTACQKLPHLTFQLEPWALCPNSPERIPIHLKKQIVLPENF